MKTVFKTKTFPTVGRVLHARSKRWDGPRPAIVVNSFGDAPYCNVNVFFDGANDREELQRVRTNDTGNTHTSVPVYDALTDEERAGLTDEVWAEWPPR